MAPAGKLGEGATAVTGAELCERLFQSAPPREGGDRELISKRQELTISIHAPREGGDTRPWLGSNEKSYFNPRPPRGGRHDTVFRGDDPVGFQSTPPVRGATAADAHSTPWGCDFNPRPREGGDSVTTRETCRGDAISIHAPREGGDDDVAEIIAAVLISIHAPREGGDR